MEITGIIDGDFLSDKVLNLCLKRLCTQFRFKTQDVLLSTIALDQPQTIKFRPAEGMGLQIINDGMCHWLLAFYDSGVVYLIDTFKRSPTPELKDSLWSLYGHHFENQMTVEYLCIPRQINNWVCGYLAVAYLVDMLNLDFRVETQYLEYGIGRRLMSFLDNNKFEKFSHTRILRHTGRSRVITIERGPHKMGRSIYDMQQLAKHGINEELVVKIDKHDFLKYV